MFDSGFFSGNRTALAQSIGKDALFVITAQSLMQRSGDVAYPFRQDSNFYYLTGVSEPDVVLVMCGKEEFLILPKRNEAEILFGGAINRDEIAKMTGIPVIYDHKEGWDIYKKLQRGRKNVYILGAPPARITYTDSFFTNGSRRALSQKLKRIFPSVIQIDVRPQLLKLRQVKQSAEVAAIKNSINITAEGFKLAKNAIADGAYEYELESEFIKAFRSRNADHAYGPIIAAGSHAVDLHYIKNNGRLSDGQLILMDVGAESHYYAADITRTYCVGNISPRQSAVYQAVQSVLEASCLLLRDGLAWREYAIEVDEIIGQHLIALGLIKKNIRREVRRYFGHGISHSLGLDVHDVCNYDTLKEGMVITVEPGIYIPEEGIGVRIEDNVLITKDGAQNLSSHIAYE